MGIWKLLTGGITGVISQYFENKEAESKAKHQRKLTKIEHSGSWETTAVGQMASSLKDEWWTFWISLPLVAIFISPFIDLIMVESYEKGMIMTVALQGLQGLQQAPDWYCYLVGISVSASFGIRGVGAAINRLKKN